MALDTNALKTKASSALSGFSTGQRAVIGIAVVTLVIGGVFFAQWASKPNLVPLFSNLGADDAGEITSKLQSSGVSYELADGGATIMVPQKDVYQTRLDLAGEGLPTGGSEGYKLLDKQGITTSEFREQVDYQRALEGELAKTIGAIDGVEAATVHLVIPKQDVFAADSKKSTASVLVKTRPGKSVEGQQTQAIVNLVASSIEGLSPDDVTVADANGRVLAAPGQSASLGGTDVKNKATQDMETDLSNKIQAMLTPLVGQGKAMVQARAQLNFDKVQTTAETFNPNNKPPVAGAESVNTETYEGGQPDATGVLGTNGVPLAQGANGNGNYNKTDRTTDYNVDRQVTQTEAAPGAVERLSVAVLLDSNVANIDQDEVTRLVTDAAGLQVARGDTVTVSRLPFDQSQAEAAKKELEEAAKAAKTDSMMNIIKSVATVLIILAVLAILYITTKRKAAAYTSTPISLAELDAVRTGPSQAEIEAERAAALSALESGSGSEQSGEALERAKVDREITDLIEKQPDEVAGLLRSWLADRRN